MPKVADVCMRRDCVSLHSGSLMQRSACPNATLPLLPLLANRGERPEWDAYLDNVYGSDVMYPVDLASFRWFYRCDCHTIGDGCMRAPTACSVASEVYFWARRQHEKTDRLQVQAKVAPETLRQPSSTLAWLSRLTSRPWTASCSGAVAPLSDVVPKIWLLTHPNNATGVADPRRGRASSSSEAFVGTVSAFWNGKWPSPDSLLAPFGWWVFPLPPPRCMEGGRWVEVMRVVQPTESEWNATFYFHAPGR